MSVKENYDRIKSDLKDNVSLIAVVKGQSFESIRELYESGQRIFAENKVQDLLNKMEYFKDYDMKWHFIGHLQKNKVKYIIDKVDLIHSLDSIKLAEKISARAIKSGKIMDCLVQVNTGSEENKFGIDIDECENFLSDLQKFEGIRVTGLMAVTPFSENPENARSYFQKMQTLFNKVRKQKYNNADIKYLSMGMSNDYQIAVEEGADMVRIGSLLFY